MQAETNFNIVDGQVLFTNDVNLSLSDGKRDELVQAISSHVDKDILSNQISETNHTPVSWFAVESLQKEEQKDLKKNKCPKSKKIEKSSKEKKEKQKKVRNDQNHVRTLIRYIVENSLATYKIQFPQGQQTDKRVLLALCQILHEDSNLESIKTLISKTFSNVSDDSKDTKLKAHADVIKGLKAEDFELERLQSTLYRLAIAGQRKKHPPKAERFCKDAYLIEYESAKRWFRLRLRL